MSEQQRLLFDMFCYVFMVFDNLGWTRAGGPTKSLRYETVLTTYKAFSKQDIIHILGPDDYADESKWKERSVRDLKPADFEPSQEETDVYVWLVRRFAMELKVVLEAEQKIAAGTATRGCLETTTGAPSAAISQRSHSTSRSMDISRPAWARSSTRGAHRAWMTPQACARQR